MNNLLSLEKILTKFREGECFSCHVAGLEENLQYSRQARGHRTFFEENGHKWRDTCLPQTIFSNVVSTTHYNKKMGRGEGWVEFYDELPQGLQLSSLLLIF